MFPRNTVTRVTSFPPAELPAFTGTMTPSDFLCSILPSFLYYQLSGILASKQENRGSPGLPHIHFVRHAMVSDPEEVLRDLPFATSILTSMSINTSSLSTTLTRLIPFNLTAYGLSSRCPTLNLRITSFDPRTRYPVTGQSSGTGFASAKICDLGPAAQCFWSALPPI